MAEPKKRLTSSRSGWRRSHQKIKIGSFIICPKCKTTILPHRVCSNCGFYKGQDILNLAQKAKAKEERRKKKESENE